MMLAKLFIYVVLVMFTGTIFLQGMSSGSGYYLMNEYPGFFGILFTTGVIACLLYWIIPSDK